ncbi:acyl-CoA synthetase FdrA [Tindallia californiensis]|uniref:FdrA protein n=1 Tax=Tindallia californiensis TaxID=159292 RepID=A0A1H3PSA4_9FIRM|nr:acyl-CoA synthetase FdrA [Tindallia californiensis]SDZ04162.1 FdrA protein [Tindallia californiensis]
MTLKSHVKKNAYYDSVVLMQVTKELKKTEGIQEVIVGMGTDLNKELAENLGLLTEEIKNATANDFFVTLEGEETIDMEDILLKIKTLLNQKKTSGGEDYRPATLRSAMKVMPEANLAIFSIPGEYAFDEVKKALEQDLHVMLFSDNVSIEEEKELKELAQEKGLLMMGPDCGTAIINQTPLAFANVVKPGNIGIVGASGTGTQEVSVIIDKLGAGVSQVIGTGGRDLKEEIGGIMMLMGMDALEKDEKTEVIVLISKPPSEKVAHKILERVKACQKPVIVDFIDGDRKMIESYGAYACISLEDTAQKAVALSKGEKPKDFDGFSIDEKLIDEMVEKELSKYSQKQRYVRGLYTGGTLAEEAQTILTESLGEIFSNKPKKPERKLANVFKSEKHTVVDLGEDEFTIGKPHPMIDPSGRADRIVEEGQDEEVAVLLMDMVLGYGAHEDPAGEMIESIQQAKAQMESVNGHLTVVASICGTEGDPQDMEESRKKLEDAGVILLPSNAQAVKFVEKILKRIQ